MHTGLLPMIIDPDTDPIPCDGDTDCDSGDLTPRERWELRCWELRRDGDPVADRCGGGR